MFFLIDSALAFLLSLPLLVVYLRISNVKEHSSKVLSWNGPLWLLNFILIQSIIADGELVWVILLFQFFLILPISIVSYIYLSNLEEAEHQSNYFKMGLKKKQFMTLGVLSILSCLLIGWSIDYNNQKVADTHTKLMNELANSDNPTELLIYETFSPETLLDILPSIDEVKDGEVDVRSSPWKSTVTVVTDNAQETIERHFTYVRFENEWKLDGSYSSSVHYKQID